MKTQGKEITRKELQAMFPSMRLAIKKVSFADLARDEAYFFTVYDKDGNKINGHGIYNDASMEKYRETFKVYSENKGDGDYRYKGSRLIPD